MEMGYGGEGGGDKKVWGLRVIGSAVKERDLMKKSVELMRPGRKTANGRIVGSASPSSSQSKRMSIDLDFFGLTEEVARPIAHSLSTNRRGGDCWGWPRLARVSVSSTNTCLPPKAAASDRAASHAADFGRDRGNWRRHRPREPWKRGGWLGGLWGLR